MKKQLSKYLSEALASHEGGTRDMRQQIDRTSARSLSASGEPDPMRWMVKVVHTGDHHQFTPGANVTVPEYGGPVALGLCGHSDLSDGDWAMMVASTHQSSLIRQPEPPAIAQGEVVGHMQTQCPDLRRFLKGGFYGRAMRYQCPEAQKAMGDIVSVIDDMLMFPEMGVVLSKLSKMPAMELGELMMRVEELAKEIGEPTTHRNAFRNLHYRAYTPQRADYELGSI